MGSGEERALLTPDNCLAEFGAPFMEVMTAWARERVAELDPEGPICTEKDKGTAAFKAGDWGRALAHYQQCIPQVEALVRCNRQEPESHTQSAVTAELAKLYANVSLVQVKLREPALAVAAADAAVAQCAWWPKAHARRGEALAADGQHGAAVHAFRMAALRAKQQGDESSASLWSARAEEEVQDEAQPTPNDAPPRCAEDARRNAGALGALGWEVMDAVVGYLSPLEVSKLEQTCFCLGLGHLGGPMGAHTREQRWRRLRCRKLRRLCNPTGRRKGLPALGAVLTPMIDAYCAEQLEAPDAALQGFVTACTPAYLNAHKGSSFNSDLFDVCLGMPPQRKEVFYRAYFTARAAWRRALPRRERGSTLQTLSGMPSMYRDERVCLRLVRECEGLLERGPLCTLLNSVDGAISGIEEARQPRQDGTLDAWATFYNKYRWFAGVDVEVLRLMSTCLKSGDDRHMELIQYCGTCLHNALRGTVRVIRRSPLYEPIGQHLMVFHRLFSAGPNPQTLTRYALDVDAAIRETPEITAAWQAMFAGAREWMEKCERGGFAVHLRAHQILAELALKPPGVKANYFSVQALLITETVAHGAREVSRRLGTADGLGQFFADLFAMVEGYNVSMPAAARQHEEAMYIFTGQRGGW
eukprot:TRINITY_DN15561_c0_g1_i1.p1 TRINITY_DN15561_c0_g1~~TRINITY_DN15561_c0_g1_i1.p1  ORF type:complete len:643 (+),score=107.69 TRINITY_DN15561_c0_g1_i1:84-2012(+)